MFAPLVTGRYGQTSEGGHFTSAPPRKNWLREVLAYLFGRKS